MQNGDPKAAADIAIKVLVKVQAGSPEQYFHWQQ